MFVIASLGVLGVAYWLCALIAHLVLMSPQERGLPAAARAGVGLLLVFTYFSAGWQLFSPAQTWLLGIILLLAYVGRHAGRLATVAFWRDFATGHWRTFVACVVIALLFFAPLAALQRFGPFSEGGGDVSIYADTALYLGNLKLAARGTSAASVADVAANFQDTLDTTINRDLTLKRALERYEKADRAPMNPPAAENAVYRSVVLRSFSPFLYVPYVALHFLSGATNYHVFYGLQALVYALLITCGWTAFRPYGRGASIAYAGLLIASHSLVSVFYNTYSAQALALFSCVLLLCLVFNGIRPWTAAGVRCCVIPFIYIWVSYAHYFSIIVPLSAIALFVHRSPGDQAPTYRARRSTVSWIALAALGFLLALLLWGGSEHSVRFLRDLVLNRIRGEQNVFMGEHIPAFSVRWLEWLFGFISQQHAAPFAVEVTWVNNAIRVGLLGSAVAVATGFAVAAYRVGTAGRERTFTREVAIFGLLALTAAAHVFSAQAYIYTQAKGAQNVIPVLYASLVVAFAMTFGSPSRRWTMRLAAALFAGALLVFGAGLTAARYVFADKLAHGLDRATILEPSYFAEARRLRETDPNVFVLFEPRTSADLYVSNEPFFGARMIPTRHLALTRMRFDVSPPEPQRVDGSFFIGDADVPHLWKLGAQRKAGRDTWRAERIAGDEPALYLFADNYVQDQRVRARPGSRDMARFSWLRNGSAMVFLPPGRAYNVEATLVVADAAQLARMRAELSRRAAAGELPEGRLQDRSGSLVIEYRMPASERPRLQRVVLFSGEYWLNVRVSGQDLPKSPFSTVDAIRLSAALVTTESGGHVVRVSWTDVEDADSQDWIGIFPEGGEDASRLAFKFTGSRKAGQVDLEMPPGSHGVFDVRFFRAGTWNAVTTTRVHIASP